MIDYKYKYLKYKKKYLLGAGKNKSRNKKNNKNKKNSTKKNNRTKSSIYEIKSVGWTKDYLENIENRQNFLLLLEFCFQNDNSEPYKLEELNLIDWILLMKEGEIFGCLSYETIEINNNFVVEISNICSFVSDKYKGICKYLLSNFLEDTEVNTFTLKVKNDNGGAINCYESCGFIEKSEEDLSEEEILEKKDLNIIKMECKKRNINVFDDSIIIEREIVL